MKPVRVALICSVGFEPFWYPLGISMLKENLERCTNISVDNYYLSSEFSWYIDRYHNHLSEINDEIGEDGNCYHELYFSTKLFNHAAPRVLVEKAMLNECNGRDIYRTRLGKTGDARKISPSDKYFVNCVMQYCELLDSFVAKKVKETNWHDYQVLGFSCLSSQLLCSAYMARSIRQLDYEGMIVFGGGMFRDWNVSQYKLLFPFIDNIVVGDGYHAILDAGRISGKPLEVFSEAKQNHYGDFSDVPKKVSRSDRFIFPVQLSDSCPWNKCLFCSIQPGQVGKISGETVYKWIVKASREYGATDFGFTDCNLNGDIDEFGKLCSLLARTDIELSFCGMLNPCDLTKQLCVDLKAAGFSQVLLGLENFSNTMLSRMKKRNTVLDNVKALKWLVEADLDEIVFNIIMDFPGTDGSVIRENLRNMEMIEHLFAENVRCDLIEFDLERDSKMCSLTGKIKLTGLTDYEFDKVRYPSKTQRILKFHGLKHRWFNIAEGWGAVEAFLKKKRRARLDLVKRKGQFLVQDSRAEKITHTLTEDELTICRYISENVSMIGGISKRTGRDKQQVKRTLERLVSLRVAITEERKYLGLLLAR